MREKETPISCNHCGKSLTYYASNIIRLRAPYICKGCGVKLRALVRRGWACEWHHPTLNAYEWLVRQRLISIPFRDTKRKREEIMSKSSEWLKQYRTSHTHVCRARDVNPVEVHKGHGIDDFVCAVVERGVREWRFMSEASLVKFKELYDHALV